MHPSSGENVNLNPRPEPVDLNPIEFEAPDPAAVEAGRAAVRRLHESKVAERADAWTGANP